MSYSDMDDLEVWMPDLFSPTMAEHRHSWVVAFKFEVVHHVNFGESVIVLGPALKGCNLSRNHCSWSLGDVWTTHTHVEFQPGSFLNTDFEWQMGVLNTAGVLTLEVGAKRHFTVPANTVSVHVQVFSWGSGATVYIYPGTTSPMGTSLHDLATFDAASTPTSSSSMRLLSQDERIAHWAKLLLHPLLFFPEPDDRPPLLDPLPLHGVTIVHLTESDFQRVKSQIETVSEVACLHAS